MEASLATAPSSGTPFTARPRKPSMDADFKDEDTVKAAGMIIVTKEGRALFLKRSDKGDHAGEWCFPGGVIEDGEEPEDTAIREVREEIDWIPEGNIQELNNHESEEDVDFTTFEVQVNNEFIPTLNDEHVGWAWVPLDDPPQPLHPGCQVVLDLALGAGLAQDIYHPSLLAEARKIQKQDGPFGVSVLASRLVDRLRQQGNRITDKARQECLDAAKNVISSAQDAKLQRQPGGSVPRYSIIHPTRGEVGVVEKLFPHEGEGWRVRQYGGNSGHVYSSFNEAKEEANYIRKKGFVTDADFKESDHPRGQPGNAGQFGPGGSGSKSKEGESKESAEKGNSGLNGYSKGASLKNGVIHTSNVNDALLALHENRKVELKQPHQVSVLMDRLASVVKDMAAKGESAPNFNLCNVTVTGSSLFCAESKGIPRIKMPQLDAGGGAAKFVEHLKSRGYEVVEDSERADHMKATQNELVGAKVAAIAKVLGSGKKLNEERLVVSEDNYIVDGHHRWAATVAHDTRKGSSNNIEMPVSRVNIDIITLLDEANKFTGGKGAKGSTGADSRKKIA